MSKIDDIAQKANVSISTVSKALNNYSDVSEKTRKKIVEIAKKCEYTIPAKRKAMQESAKRNIGIIFSENGEESKFESNFYSLYIGAVKTCEKYGYEPIILNTNPIKQLTKSLEQLCHEYNLSGFILNGLVLTDAYYREILTLNIPCAVIDLEIITMEDNDFNSDKVSVITTDTLSAVEDIVNLLYRKNYRHIGFINGTSDAEIYVVREQAFIKAMKNKNMELCEKYMISSSCSDITACEQAKSLIMNYPEISAIFATTDYLAIGVYKAAEELGRKIPEDLAVIGYDGIAISEFVSPPLTTIKQDFRKMAQTGVESVIKRINGQKAKALYKLPYEFIIRESV